MGMYKYRVIGMHGERVYRIRDCAEADFAKIRGRAIGDGRDNTNSSNHSLIHTYYI